MPKFKVTISLTYTVEANSADDAQWLIEAGRDDGSLPLYYWCDQEDYDTFNKHHREHWMREASSGIMLSKDGGAEYEVEEV